jgi:clan AA aspartic protease
MVAGRVSSFLEAMVSLSLQSPQGHEQTIEAVVDTGFNGHLTLPADVIAGLGLPFRRSGRAVLADGSSITFDIHEAVIFWDGQPRRIPVDAADTEPLLGMGLLYGSELAIEVVESGSVLIRTLPLS